MVTCEAKESIADVFAESHLDKIHNISTQIFDDGRYIDHHLLNQFYINLMS